MGGVSLLVLTATLSPLGKVHGSLARAGKVRGQTPKVSPACGLGGGCKPSLLASIRRCREAWGWVRVRAR